MPLQLSARRPHRASKKPQTAPTVRALDRKQPWEDIHTRRGSSQPPHVPQFRIERPVIFLDLAKVWRERLGSAQNGGTLCNLRRKGQSLYATAQVRQSRQVLLPRIAKKVEAIQHRVIGRARAGRGQIAEPKWLGPRYKSFGGHGRRHETSRKVEMYIDLDRPIGGRHDSRMLGIQMR